MKKISSILFAASMLTTTQCQCEHALNKKDTLPFVSIRKDPSFCGGVMVSNNKVLTALHCVDDKEIVDIYVDKRYVKAKICARDDKGDLALLEFIPVVHISKWATWRYPVNEEKVKVQTLNANVKSTVLSVSLFWNESAIDYKASRGDSGSPVWSDPDHELLCIITRTSADHNAQHSYCKNVSEFLDIYFAKK